MHILYIHTLYKKAEKGKNFGSSYRGYNDTNWSIFDNLQLTLQCHFNVIFAVTLTFLQLTVLKARRADEVAYHVIDMFTIFGTDVLTIFGTLYKKYNRK